MRPDYYCLAELYRIRVGVLHVGHWVSIKKPHHRVMAGPYVGGGGGNRTVLVTC